MAEIKRIYKCEVCGNIIEVILANDGDLTCCNKKMNLLEEKTSDQEGNEKHSPVIESNEEKIKIKVGSIEHPMEKEHFIEFIELHVNEEVHRKMLSPGMPSEVEFCVPKAEGQIYARAYCNVHGLWKSS